MNKILLTFLCMFAGLLSAFLLRFVIIFITNWKLKADLPIPGKYYRKIPYWWDCLDREKEIKISYDLFLSMYYIGEATLFESSSGDIYPKVCGTYVGFNFFDFMKFIGFCKAKDKKDSNEKELEKYKVFIEKCRKKIKEHSEQAEQELKQAEEMMKR